MDILKVERHTEGGCVYGIRFFSRGSVCPAPARASASRRMVFTASPRTKRSKRACRRCRGKTCLQITKTAYRAKNSVGGFQLRQQESNLRWGSQSPLPYRLAMAHCRILFYPNFPAMSSRKTVVLSIWKNLDIIAIQLFNATATTLNCISQICCLNVALISWLAIKAQASR